MLDGGGVVDVGMLPEVHFGKVEDQPFDWRSSPEEPDPDDELVETPEETIALIGFDPLEDAD